MMSSSLSNGGLESSNFLTQDLANKIRDEHGTPCYVYDSSTLKSQAALALAFPNPYGLTVRYAMKACPNAAIIKIFHNLGIHFDVSSGFEAERAILAGIPPCNLSLSSQELPMYSQFKKLINLGVNFNACSLHQLESYGKLIESNRKEGICTDSKGVMNGECGIRFNPGKGSGGNGKTNVGGPSSSFGVWYSLKNKCKDIALKYNINIIRIHTHIGSGSDPNIWKSCAGK